MSDKSTIEWTDATWNPTTGWWPCDPEQLDVIYHRVGKSKSGALLDGREWNEFPEVAHV